jgi:hypothetical protein
MKIKSTKQEFDDIQSSLNSIRMTFGQKNSLQNIQGQGSDQDWLLVDQEQAL